MDECLSVKATEEISLAEQPGQYSGFRDNLNPAYDLDPDVDDSPAMLRNDRGHEKTSSQSPVELAPNSDRITLTTTTSSLFEETNHLACQTSRVIKLSIPSLLN